MRNLLTTITFIIFTKVVLSGNTSEKLEYVLDVLGDNNYERIDTNFSDPGITIFTPVKGYEIGKVLYGERTIWTRGKNQHFMRLEVFREGTEHKFMHLELKEGNKDKGLVFVRDGDVWNYTGKYDIKKDEKTGEKLSPLAVISSNFSKLTKLLKRSKSKKSSKTTEDLKEINDLVELAELNISGDPEEVSVIKKYISLNTPTIEYTPFIDKKIMRVVDRFQTVWKHTNDKKPLKKVKGFNKLGETRLLLVMTEDTFDKGASYYEFVNDEWRSIPKDRFYFKMRMRLFDDVDPEFDMPTKKMISDLESIENKYPGSSKSLSSSPGAAETPEYTGFTRATGSHEHSDLDLPVPERVGSLSSLNSMINKMWTKLPKPRRRKYSYDLVPSDEEGDQGSQEKESVEEVGTPEKESVEEQGEQDQSENTGSEEEGSTKLGRLGKLLRQKAKKLKRGRVWSRSLDDKEGRRSSTSSDSDDESFRINYHIGDKDSSLTNTISIRKDPENERPYSITKIEPESDIHKVDIIKDLGTIVSKSSRSPGYSREHGFSDFDSPKPLVSYGLPGEPRSLVSHLGPMKSKGIGDHEQKESGSHGESIDSDRSTPPAPPGTPRTPDGSGMIGGNDPFENDLPVFESGSLVKGPVREQEFKSLSSPVQEIGEKISQGTQEKPVPKPRKYIPLKREATTQTPGHYGVGSQGKGPVSLGYEYMGHGHPGKGIEYQPRSLQHIPGSTHSGYGTGKPGVIDLLGQRSSSSGSTPEEDEYHSDNDEPKSLKSGEYPILERIRSIFGGDSSKSSSISDSKLKEEGKDKSMSTSKGSSGSGSGSFSKGYKKVFKDGDVSSTSESEGPHETQGELEEQGEQETPETTGSEERTEDSEQQKSTEDSEQETQTEDSGQQETEEQQELPGTEDESPETVSEQASGSKSLGSQFPSFHLSDLPSTSTDDSSTTSSGSRQISSRPESIFHMTDLDTPSDENEGQGNM